MSVCQKLHLGRIVEALHNPVLLSGRHKYIIIHYCRWGLKFWKAATFFDPWDCQTIKTPVHLQ